MTRFELPYYPQTAEFTCGPACVLMAMAALQGDEGLLTREMEFQIWRRTNLVGVGAADVFTLAQPFLENGYGVRLFNERTPTFERARVVACADEEAADLTLMASDMARAAIDRADVAVIERAPLVADVEAALDGDWLPICLVGMQEVHDEEVPHWVVVYAIDDEGVHFHDPYYQTGGPDLVRSAEVFQKMLDDMDAMHCSRGMVLVRSVKG